MADLSKDERDALKDSDFAVPEKRALPMHDAKHARLAWDMVDRTDGLSDEEKAEARSRIKARLKELGDPLKDDGDADDKPAGDDKDRAAQPAATAVEMPAPSPYYVIPITRVDRENRVVEGVATSEAVDSFGTVFGYEASKQAFSDWAGNVREMHDRKAVGRRFEIRFDDDARRVHVRSKISKGAPDTWEKVLDGTLSGYSIGAADCVWERREIGGRAVPYCTRYRLAELSLVDAASNPDARQGLAIVRADAADPSPAIFEDLTQPAPAEQLRAEQADTTREGRTISAATREKLHGMRDAAMGAAKSAMDACGCDDCQQMNGGMDGDDDNDRALIAVVTRILDTTLSPVRREVALLRAVAAQAPDATRFDRIDGDLGKVSTALAAIEGRLAKIEEQPLPGGPALRAVGLTAADKTLMTGGGTAAPASLSEMDAAGLQRLASSTSDVNLQMVIAGELTRRAQATPRS